MNLHYSFAILLLFYTSFPSISAYIFPNVSSIPPGLARNSTKTPWDNFKNLLGCRSGQKLDGVAKLKHYLNHFGYIDSVSNFTDDFDDVLQSAIKTYQLNFHLNVTGELDQKTIDQLSRPRCGNADIVNGTTSMNSGKWTTSPNFHTVGRYTFFPGNPRWPEGQRDLTYTFWPDNRLTDAEKSLFARAFDRWAAVIPMTFTEIDSFNGADIKIGFFSGDHGDREPFDGVLGTLAHAFSPPSGRLHLDADENWVVAGDISSAIVSSAVDLESVAVHEIGHLLGLGHSSEEEAIMYPTLPSRSKRVDLTTDDILGVQELYGKNPNYNGSASSTPSIQERDTSGAYNSHTRWGLVSFIAVGLAFLAS